MGAEPMDNEHAITADEPSVDWLEEILESSFAEELNGAWRCSTNTFSLSRHWGNNGRWCTATRECMTWC